MKLLSCVVAGAFLAVASFSGASAGDVSKAEISKILSDGGHSVRDFDSNKIIVEVGEYYVIVAVAGTDSDITYITYLGSVDIQSLGYEFLSKFNSEVKFGRAYVDRDGDVAIQMDRNSSGGVSSKNIESDFDVFLTLVSKFISDVQNQLVA